MEWVVLFLQYGNIGLSIDLLTFGLSCSYVYLFLEHNRYLDIFRFGIRPINSVPVLIDPLYDILPSYLIHIVIQRQIHLGLS